MSNGMPATDTPQSKPQGATTSDGRDSGTGVLGGLLERSLKLAKPAFWLLLIVLAATVSVLLAVTEISGPRQVVSITYESPTEGGSTLFFASDGEWGEGASETVHSIAGVNRAVFSLPRSYGTTIRWDPGTSAGVYTIDSIIVSSRQSTVRFDTAEVVGSPDGRQERQSLSTDGTRMVLRSLDEDPQLLLDMSAAAGSSRPGRWVFGLIGVATLMALSLALAAHRRGLWNESYVATGLVMWLYLVFGYYVLVLGSRLPFWDDWRYLRRVDSDGKLPISLRSVFEVENDTLAATGRLLDYLTLNATSFSFRAVQFVGLIILGFFLAFAIAVIRRFHARDIEGIKPFTILLLGWSLVAMSYWLQPANAYHQMLPLMCGVIILFLLQMSWSVYLKVGLAICLSVAAALAYVSGAIMVLVVASAMIIVARLAVTSGEDRRQLRWLGATLAVVGSFALAAQIVAVSLSQGSLSSTSSLDSVAYPWQPEFWGFLLGVLARSVGVTTGPLISYLAVGAVFLVSPFVAFVVVRHKASKLNAIAATSLLFGSLLVPAYGGAVAYGRGATLGSVGFTASLAAGGTRFHFWWIAAMLPFVWLAWRLWLTQQRVSTRGAALVIVTVVTLVLAVPKGVSPWRYETAFAERRLAFDRNLTCVSSNVLQTNASIVCRHASSGEIGPQVWTAYEYDMRFLSEAGMPSEDEVRMLTDDSGASAYVSRQNPVGSR